MPQISAFHGIVILMYWYDHNPPHFHVSYRGQDIMVRVTPPQILRGTLPGRIERLVCEWATVRQAKLLANWQKAQQGVPLDWIDPV